jgi:hypothetical protein
MAGAFSCFRPCATLGCKTQVIGSGLYCAGCWKKTESGRKEAVEAARIHAWKLKEQRRLAAGEPVPDLHCMRCSFWDEGRCSFSFPEAGGVFAADCSLYLLDDERIFPGDSPRRRKPSLALQARRC